MLRQVKISVFNPRTPVSWSAERIREDHVTFGKYIGLFFMGLALKPFASPASPQMPPNSQEIKIPDQLKPPAGEALILSVHATGHQIYVCQAGSDGKRAWTLKAPQAELFDEKGVAIGSHYAGPTWKLNDGSEVTGKMAARVDAPDESAIPWLLVTVASNSGKGALMHATSIQRIHTLGGLPPAECAESQLGTETKSSYTADYYFYAPKK
jgi:hypothetical protein